MSHHWLNTTSPITNTVGRNVLDNSCGGNELNRSLKRHSWGKPPANGSLY